MSICKKHLYDSSIRSQVAILYRESLLTMGQIAMRLDISHHTVCAILNSKIPEVELARLKALKYSESKTGHKNPQKGKPAHNRIGDCRDGHGYLTRVVDGKRYFVHRIVIAELLDMHVSKLPEGLKVHHIDENKENNHPDNLALSTVVGHRSIHMRYLQTPEQQRMKKLSLAQAIRLHIAPECLEA